MFINLWFVYFLWGDLVQLTGCKNPLTACLHFEFLFFAGCLLRTDQETTHSPILILDNLEKVNMASIFGPLLDPVAYRGIQHAFFLTGMFSYGTHKSCQAYLAWTYRSPLIVYWTVQIIWMSAWTLCWQNKCLRVLLRVLWVIFV